MSEKLKNNETEHKKILEDINSLFIQIGTFKEQINFNDDTIYSEHLEYIEWANHQIKSLFDSLFLLKSNSYKSSFVLIRSVFESYFVLHLAMNGLKFNFEFPVRDGHNPMTIYHQWKEDFESNKEEKQKEGIWEIHNPQNKRKIKVTYIGRKTENGSVIPNYYFLFKEYNSIIANVGLEEEYFESEELSNVREELVRKHKGLKNLFSFGNGIRENLLLNDLITEKDFERIKIHYNFLSNWTHPSYQSIKYINGNSLNTNNGYLDINEYNFDLTRISYLYIGNILILFLKSLLTFFERQIEEGKINEITNKEEIKEIISNFENNTNYFWFIFNEPHYLYKWQWALKLISRESVDYVKKIVIGNLTADDIEYYKDPIDAMKMIKTSSYNAIIGKCISPLLHESGGDL